MRFPRLKDLRVRLSSARLLGNLIKNSITFKLKRKALRRFRATDFETIIVDMDGTLFRTDANLEALSICYPEIVDGKIAGEEIYDSLIKKIASGEYSIEKAIIEGNKFLMARKMRKQDFYKVLDKVKPLIRKPLVRALSQIKSNGKQVVLATLSSKDFAEIVGSYLKSKFGFEFDCICGTELNFDEAGFIVGIKSIVGTKDFELEGIKVMSKLSVIKESLQAKGLNFDQKKAVIITDSYGDIDVAKSIVTILIRQHNPSMAQKVSYKLGLADYLFPDNKDLETNLVSLILGSEKPLGIEEV
ncbi:MAG: HAD family hydrolase [Candidatus Diapherotrites archaeon]